MPTPSKSQAGRGSQLEIGATPTLIGECSDIPFNRGEWNNVDVTNLDSGSDEEILPTIRMTATFDIKGNRVSSDAGQVLAEAAYQSGSVEAFALTLPKTATQVTKGDTYAFNAYVLASDFTVAPTKQIEFTLKLKTTGPVTLTVGS